MGLTDWTNTEVNFIVSDYFSMLNDELKGFSVNKSNHRKLLLPLLNSRSEGSIEFKHQNISAVLAEMGLPFIKGYKPRFNYQKSIINAIEQFLFKVPQIENSFNEFALNDSGTINYVSYNDLLVAPPKTGVNKNKELRIKSPIKVNYLEREQNNQILGLKGEELAFEYERFQLIKSGKDSLADSIEWVSKTQGDGLGFDILSKNLNGTDKYIEVKTTKLTIETPIYFSANEYDFSTKNEKNYHLYRIFNFDEKPKMFTLNGSYNQFCQMEPIQYRGNF